MARGLGLSRAGELAGLALFALNPFQVFYAHDARMYPLLQLAVLAALAAGLRRRWLWMGAGLAVALWTHNYGLIYAAVLGLLMLARELRLPVLSWDGERLIRVADLRGVCLAVIVPLLPGVNPRLASARAGLSTEGRLEPPGPLARNYGVQTPVVTLVAHVVFGVVLGAVLSP